MFMAEEAAQKGQKQKGFNTPFDDAFKSIISKCPALAIYLINEMFFRTGLSDEEYTGKERVVRLDKEIPNLDAPNRERDTRFEIWGRTRRQFHLECQSTGDGTVILRMVRYTMTGALETAEYDKGTIHVNLDDSGVLFLRSTKNTPSVMNVVVSARQNQTLTYQIPVLKIKDYTLETILERKLFILLPFLFFNHESKLRKANRDEKIYAEINELYDQIIKELKKKADDGVITAYEAATLFDALKIVFEALGNTNQAKEEVKKIMGGRVLEFSADKYFNAGEAHGEKIGEAKGEDKGIDYTMDLVGELLRAGDYEELMRMANDREYTKKKVQILKES